LGNSILPNIETSCKQVTPGREEAVDCLQLPSVVDNVYDIVNGYENPFTGWNSYQAKELIRFEHEKWVYQLADWKSFISLTFRDEKTPDVAMSLFKWFIRTNNEHAFGKHYTNKVGHSYFSYVVGLEYQTRDVVHFHALIDKPIDFSYVHKTWGKRCGFAWIDGDIKSKARAVNYVCKYCVKGGQLEAYVNKKNVLPEPLPDWWRDASSTVVNHAENEPILSAEAAASLQMLLDWLGQV